MAGEKTEQVFLIPHLNRNRYSYKVVKMKSVRRTTVVITLEVVGLYCT